MIPPGVDRVAGPELGGVPLATAVSLETGLPFVIVKKEPKGYGTDNLVEGELNEGDRVVVLEDIMTTGAQGIHAARRLSSAGARVELILGVIDRGQGARENVARAGFAVKALFNREDLGV
jgi:orotate phosphoribosyltransferase